VRLDVYLTAAEVAPGALNGAVVAVIDVLRASTSIAVAIANGARAVVPFEGVDEVAEHAKQFEKKDVRMAGERKMLPIAGFDLGNSPGQFTSDAVNGKTVLMTTTNGTHAMLACQGARDTAVASYVNGSAVSALLRSALRSNTPVAILCAGQDRRFALEDAGCAGHYVRLVTRRFADVALNDAAHACALIDRKYGDDIQALFLDSAHGRALKDAGFDADLDICAGLDTYPVVPVYTDRQITRLGSDNAR
jgi:2-phosphosulfolactate phosphatase